MPTETTPVKGKLFSEYHQGDVFYRKVGGAVFKMVKAPKGTAVMFDDAPAAMSGEEVAYYKVPADELMLDERDDIVARAKTAV